MWHRFSPRRELRRLIQREARSQQRRVEEEPDEILHGLVRLVCRGFLLELRHDGVVRVHLHGLLRHHVRAHGAVAQSLRLHDALHVRRPAVLRGHEDNRGLGDAGADQHLLDLGNQTVQN